MPKETGYSLNKRGYYVINKQYQGVRLYESTEFRKGQEKEIIARIREWKTEVYNGRKRGIRPVLSFAQCTLEYYQAKDNKTLENVIGCLKRFVDYIGEVPANELHNTHPDYLALKSDWSELSNTTIRHYIGHINNVLKFAMNTINPATKLTMIERIPLLSRPKRDTKEIAPITWEQQDTIMRVQGTLPQQDFNLQRVKDMCLLSANTGLRDSELVDLQWKNELVGLPNGMKGFVSVNKSTSQNANREKVIILNNIAQGIIEKYRGVHPDYVFTFRGKPVKRLHNTAFKRLRELSGIDFTVHQFRHTFAARLENAGIEKEYVSIMLGHHKESDVTRMYMATSLQRMHNAVTAIEERQEFNSVIDIEQYRRKA